MPVVPMREILDAAFAERYGVAAINIVDDLSLEAVLAAATELEAPLIVQTSLKTVKSIGAGPLYGMWRRDGRRAPVPVTLHLDHCPDREWITTCLEAGWNSVLFDGSQLDVAENTRQTIEVVAEAERATAPRSRARSRASPASRTASAPTTAATSIRRRGLGEFIAATGVYAFAPAIGTAHGLYAAEPHLDARARHRDRRRAPDPDGAARRHRADRGAVPDLIARGCAKVNISTALKIAFVDAHREYLDANPGKHDPPSLLEHVRAAVKDMAERAHPHLRLGRQGAARPRPPECPR